MKNATLRRLLALLSILTMFLASVCYTAAAAIPRAPSMMIKARLSSSADVNPQIPEIPSQKLMEIARTYIRLLRPKGSVLTYSWETPHELNPDDLINICAFHNFLQLPLDGHGLYVNPNAPAGLVERAIQKFFHVNIGHLRKSNLYDAETRTYTLQSGWSGGYGYYPLNVRQQKDKIMIDVVKSEGLADPVNPLGTLTIQRKDQENYQFVSFIQAPLSDGFNQDPGNVKMSSEDLMDIARVYTRMLIPTGSAWAYSWARPIDINPDDLIHICAYNNYLDLPINVHDLYQNPAAPAKWVEACIQKYFDVSSAFLRKSALYDAAAQTYDLTAGADGGFAYHPIGVRQEKDQLVIEIGLKGHAEDPALFMGVLTIEKKDKGYYQYVSFLKEPIPPSADKDLRESDMSRDELLDIARMYARMLCPTGSAWAYTWETPLDIKPDDLIGICAYNNFLNLPLNNRNLYVHPSAPAKSVERSIQKYFNVTSAYLNTSNLYDAASDTYEMLGGWGGGYAYIPLEVQQKENLLMIQIGKRADLAFPESPMGTLTLERKNDYVQYVSFVCAIDRND